MLATMLLFFRKKKLHCSQHCCARAPHTEAQTRESHTKGCTGILRYSLRVSSALPESAAGEQNTERGHEHVAFPPGLYATTSVRVNRNTTVYELDYLPMCTAATNLVPRLLHLISCRLTGVRGPRLVTLALRDTSLQRDMRDKE